MIAYLYLAIAIVFEVVGTMSLKYSEGFSKLYPTLITMGAYYVSFFFLGMTLKTLSVGFSYAIWSAVGLVLVACLGVFLFKEKVDIAGIIGITFIVIGVVTLNLFSKMSGH